MFKFVILLCACIAAASAGYLGAAPIAYSTPLAYSAPLPIAAPAPILRAGLPIAAPAPILRTGLPLAAPILRAPYAYGAGYY